jgi:hypothetical protein
MFESADLGKKKDHRMFDPSTQPYSRVAYHEGLTNTDHWDHFVPHNGDIFICTPPKNGTTWMQTIVTFLLFGSSDLDFIPADRSPWFDMTMRPVEESLARFEWDDKRNVIKTHTPLDGIPFLEYATYIGVLRDPRDAFFSMRNHAENMIMDIGLTDQDIIDQFRSWVEDDYVPGGETRCLGFPVHYLRTLWDQRHRPNIHLFHYSDMLRDLKGEMRRLADILNIEIDDMLLSSLAEAAGFNNMRSNFEKFIPGKKGEFWHEPREFLKTGTSGQWQGVVPDDLLKAFDIRLMELADEDMGAWLLGGNTGAHG